MATHSSIVAWAIPWTEETGGLQSVESHLKETFKMDLQIKKQPQREVVLSDKSLRLSLV